MSTTPHITDLRTHLMETLSALRCRDSPMEPDRARAVAQVAGVLVDTAKVEIEYIKATGGDRSDFIERPNALPAIAHSDTPTPHNPFPTVRRHTLEG